MDCACECVSLFACAYWLLSACLLLWERAQCAQNPSARLAALPGLSPPYFNRLTCVCVGVHACVSVSMSACACHFQSVCGVSVCVHVEVCECVCVPVCVHAWTCV